MTQRGSLDSEQGGTEVRCRGADAMEVEDAEPGRAMTPEEVLDELRDEVRESETTYETHEHMLCHGGCVRLKKKKRFCLGRGRGRLPPAFRQGLADPLSLSLSLSHVSCSGEGGA